MANKFTPGCCCGCIVSPNPKLYPDWYPADRVRCFHTDLTRTATRTIINTQTIVYVGGVESSNTSSSSDTTITVDADATTITEDLEAGYFEGLEVLTTTLSPRVETFDPPEAADGSIANYTRVILTGSVQKRVTKKWRKRLVLQWDSDPFPDFQEQLATDGSTYLVLACRFIYEGVVLYGTGAVTQRSKTSDVGLPETVDEFDTAFATADVPAGTSPFQTRSSIPADYAKLTVYADSPALTNAREFKKPRMVVQEFFNTSGDTFTVGDWRNYYELTTDPETGGRTYTTKKRLPSNDIQFSWMVGINDEYLSVLSTHKFELFNDSGVVLTIQLQLGLLSDDGVLDSMLDHTEVSGSPIYGTLQITGLGLDGEFQMRYPTRGDGLPPYTGTSFYPGVGFTLALYDNTLYFGVADQTPDRNEVVMPLPSDAGVIAYRSDQRWLTGLNKLVLPRDATISPKVKARLSSDDPRVFFQCLAYRETESLQTIGIDRVPYDGDLDESKDPKGCPEPVEYCSLIGTEENLRLEADLTWGSISKFIPLLAEKCSAQNSRSLGNIPVRGSSTLAYFYRYFSTVEFTPGSPPTVSSTSTTIEDYTTYDKPPMDLDVTCELTRDESGDLQIEITLSIGYFYPAAGPVTVSIGGTPPLDPDNPTLVYLDPLTSPGDFMRYIYAIDQGYILKWIVPLGTDSLASIADLPEEVTLLGSDAELINDGSVPHPYEIYESMSLSYSDWEWNAGAGTYRSTLTLSAPTEQIDYPSLQLKIRPQSYSPLAEDV